MFHLTHTDKTLLCGTSVLGLAAMKQVQDVATCRGQSQETRAPYPRALPLATPCTFLPTLTQSGSWGLNHRTGARL